MTAAKSGEEPNQQQLETLIKEIDPKAFESIPQKARPRIARLIQTVAFQANVSQFSGPLPPPDALAKYNEILPGAADRIIKMAEEQSAHRKQLETKVVDAQINQSNRGQWMALGVALLFLSGAVWVTLSGHDAVGGTLGGVTVCGLVASFIASRRQQKADLTEKISGTQSRKRT